MSRHRRYQTRSGVWIGTACSGAGCAVRGTVKHVTVTYTLSPTISDPAGNPAGGTFTKTQTMF
jgi:hypothetical protein